MLSFPAETHTYMGGTARSKSPQMPLFKSHYPVVIPQNHLLERTFVLAVTWRLISDRASFFLGFFFAICRSTTLHAFDYRGRVCKL